MEEEEEYCAGGEALGTTCAVSVRFCCVGSVASVVTGRWGSWSLLIRPIASSVLASSSLSEPEPKRCTGRLDSEEEDELLIRCCGEAKLVRSGKLERVLGKTPREGECLSNVYSRTVSVLPAHQLVCWSSNVYWRSHTAGEDVAHCFVHTVSVRRREKVRSLSERSRGGGKRKRQVGSV